MSVIASSTIKLIYVFNLIYDLGFYNWLADLTIKETNLKFYITLYKLSSYIIVTMTAAIVNTDIKV
jgi:hypothetical protein